MPSPFSLQHQLARALWKLTWLMLCRWTPRPLHAWRALVVGLWGAKLGKRVHIYPGAIIWAPWQLVMGDDASIADGAEIYNAAVVTFGVRAIVSQSAFICTATHDYQKEEFPMTWEPITLGDRCWVASRAIILPGVYIGAGAVVGAGSVVTKSVEAHTVVAGNPARVVKKEEAK